MGPLVSKEGFPPRVPTASCGPIGKLGIQLDHDYISISTWIF